MRRLTGHLGVWSGKRVLVLMRDGHHFVAKFKDKRRHEIWFFDHEPVDKLNIRTLSIYKGDPK